jgi:hypothetical protein
MTARLSHRDVDACSRVLQELYAESSLPKFADRVLPLIAKLVPSGHISYNDFNERLGRFVIRRHPERPEAEKLLPRFAAHFHTHPLHEHYLNGDVMPKRISDVATVRQFIQTPIYQEYYVRWTRGIRSFFSCTMRMIHASVWP